jgi:hypothetical protein
MEAEMFLRRLTFAALLFALPRAAAAGEVATSADLRAAIASAQPGATIHLAPGAYALGEPLATQTAGTMAQPILITADAASAVRLDVSAGEGLVIAHPYWIVEHVWLNGVGGGAGSAIHLTPGADNFVVRGSRITNFATGILTDRSAVAEVSTGTVQANEFYNDALAVGGTPMRIVGGQGWHIVGNYLHDYGGSGAHAGISLEGGATGVVVEQNLLACGKDHPPTGMASGVFVGGPGTMPSLCAATNRGPSSCACETSAGLVRNNIVAHCLGAGIAANRVCATKVHGNTVYDTTPGLDVQAAGATGTIDAKFNVFSGTATGVPATDNVASLPAPMFKMVYLDPDGLDYFQGPNDKVINDIGAGMLGKTDPDLPLDYTGSMRKPTLDWGAMELPATLHTWPWAGAAAIGMGPVPPPPSVVDAGAVLMEAGPPAEGGEPGDTGAAADAQEPGDTSAAPDDATSGGGAPEVATGSSGTPAGSGTSGAAAAGGASVGSAAGGCSAAGTAPFAGGRHSLATFLLLALPLILRQRRR